MTLFLSVNIFVSILRCCILNIFMFPEKLAQICPFHHSLYRLRLLLAQCNRYMVMMMMMMVMVMMRRRRPLMTIT